LCPLAACKAAGGWAYYPAGVDAAMGSLANRLAGRFLVIDGPDGAGKSTQVAMLAGVLRAEGVAVRTVQDPGGTRIGGRIREILLDREHGEMGVECELMLYMASRAQLAHEVIRPALAAGQCVLGDRYISSTIAYQGAGGVEAEAVRQAGRIAVGETWPAMTLVLDLPSEEGLARAGKAAGHDRMEAKGIAFHRKVRERFLLQAQEDPGHYVVVDATGTPQDVHRRVRQAVEDWAISSA